MRLYKVEINNDLDYYSDGAVKLETYILADDVTAAVTIAFDLCSRLQEKLRSFPEPLVSEVRVTFINEAWASMINGVGFKDGQDIDIVASRAYDKVKKATHR